LIHLTLQQLSSYLDREMSDSSRALVEDHLAICDGCSSKYARLERQERDLVRLLTHDLDEVFFAGFGARLRERIELKPAAGVPAPMEPDAAPARDRLEPAMPQARAVEPEPVAPAGAGTGARRGGFPWVAAIVIFAIAGSIGAASIGSEFASRWLGRSPSGKVRPLSHFGSSAAPEAATDLDATAPAGTPEAAPPGSVLPAPAGAPEAARPEPATLPTAAAPRAPVTSPSRPSNSGSPASPPAATTPPVAREDDDVVWTPDPYEPPPSQEAAPSGPGTAEEYDSVATKLERSLPMLQGADYREARFHLAEARYKAWQLDPTSDRTQAVTRAIRAYLISAPDGPDRESAQAWLSEIQTAGY
jgi:hypothetical protein